MAVSATNQCDGAKPDGVVSRVHFDDVHGEPEHAVGLLIPGHNGPQV